jgi:hypothetical protein
LTLLSVLGDQVRRLVPVSCHSTCCYPSTASSSRTISTILQQPSDINMGSSMGDEPGPSRPRSSPSSTPAVPRGYPNLQTATQVCCVTFSRETRTHEDDCVKLKKTLSFPREFRRTASRQEDCLRVLRSSKPARVSSLVQHSFTSPIIQHSRSRISEGDSARLWKRLSEVRMCLSSLRRGWERGACNIVCC